MRRSKTALHSVHRATSASAYQHSQRSDFGKAPPVVRREDDQAYRNREERVKVRFDVSAHPPLPSITYSRGRSTPRQKLDIIRTGQEKFISTVGSNLVHVGAQQHQPLLRLLLSTNGGVATHTAAVVRRHEGNKLDK